MLFFFILFQLLVIDGLSNSPSWGDEFLTPLLREYGDRLILKNTQNPSVKATIEILEQINKRKFILS